MKLEDVPGDTPGNSIGGTQVLNSADSKAVENSGSTAPPTSVPAGESPAVPAQPMPDGNLKSVGPENTAPLPPVEKPAEAEAQHNDAAGGPGAIPATTNGKKNPKVKVDQSKESSSKHKKKKGIDKLNPF